MAGRTGLFLLLSGFGAAASWICYFRALKAGDASKVASVDKLSLVLVALVAAAFLGERLSAGGWLGIVLMAAGAILLGWKG